MITFESVIGVVSVILGIVLTVLKILEQYNKVSPKIKEILQRASVAWFILLFILVGFSLNYVLSINEERLPENVSSINIFGKSGKLPYVNVCDDSLQTPWWENCVEDSENIKIVSNFFQGRKSVEVNIEASPHRAQVYSVNIPLEKPEVADNVSAKIYIPDKNLFSSVDIALFVAQDDWLNSAFQPPSNGWMVINLDLQHFLLPSGETARGKSVEYIHFDFYVPQSTSYVQKNIRLEYVYFIFPSSEAILLDQ